MSEIGISHNPDNFTEKPIILTLQDKPLLNEKGQLDDSADILHNANLRESELAHRNLRRKAKLLDEEDKFGDRLLLGSENILPQYADTKDCLRKAKFAVSSCKINSSISKADKFRENLKKGKPILEDLREARLLSDYLTADEMPKPSQPMHLKSRRKHNTASKQPLPTQNTNLKIKSRGSRKNQRHLKNDETLKADRNRPKLEEIRDEQQVAADIEEKATSLLSSKLNNCQTEPTDFSAITPSHSTNPLLTLNQTPSLNPKEIVKRVKAIKKSKSLQKSNQITFDETSAFLMNLQEDKFNPEINPKTIGKSGETVKNDQKTTEIDQKTIKTVKNDQKTTEIDQKTIKTIESIREPLSKDSISDALRLYKAKGMLQQKARHDFMGRHNDERPSYFQEEKDPLEVKLEYLDSGTGRPLTRKQAFRNLSHIFHGQKPGDSKKAKLERKMKEVRRTQSKSLTETPLGLVEKTKCRTRKSGKAFVKLDQSRNAALMELTKKS